MRLRLPPMFHRPPSHCGFRILSSAEILVSKQGCGSPHGGYQYLDEVSQIFEEENDFQVDPKMLGALLLMAGVPKFIDTAKAAAMLNRKPQTLRKWSCKKTGPITPIHINGRLHWRVTDLLALMNGVPHE